ncbi:hypothetical protein HYV80_04945 [Candidatus Woesearchaeota archaeon]|nr:hypothetical protein [Candidatus Woesearchaeota archaeon]
MNLPLAPNLEKYLEERGDLEVEGSPRRLNGLTIWRVKLDGKHLGVYQIFYDGDITLSQEFVFHRTLPGYEDWRKNPEMVRRYGERVADTIEGREPLWPSMLTFGIYPDTPRARRQYAKQIRLDRHTSIPFP